MATSTLKKITPADIGAAANSAAMQFRGWYPNGQSMLSLTPGYYQTNPGALPSETFPNGINAYGTLCVNDTGYTHITYISVLGDFMFWKSNSNEWYIVQYQGRVPIASGGTDATTAAGARANLGITPANIGAMSVNPAKIELYAPSGSGSYIDFHYNGSTSDNTVRIMESAEGVLSIKAAGDNAYYPILTTKNGVTHKSINTTSSGHANIDLGIGYSSSVPIALNAKTSDGINVYAEFGRWSTADNGDWGAKLCADVLSNGTVQLLTNKQIVGTLYYIPF